VLIEFFSECNAVLLIISTVFNVLGLQIEHI
jgi:hypothetical protein